MLLLVIFGGWALNDVFTALLGDRIFVWNLTPLGMDAFVLVVALLLVVAAWTLASSPRSVLSLIVLVLLILNAPRFLVAFRGFGTMTVLAGAVAITWCNAAGARERHVRHVPTTVVGGVVSFLALSLYLLGCVFSLGQGLGANTEYVHAGSSDGSWTLRAAEYDAVFDVTQTVTVSREFFGLLSLQRDVYAGNQDRPSVQWVDARTLEVNGRPFDIFRDRAIDVYE